MSVTFYPSLQNITALSPHIIEHRAANDSMSMLKGACPHKLVGTCKETFQSSFEDLNTLPFPTIPTSNGFVNGAIQAYSTHQKLVIRPDDIWITILTQFSLFVNANAEQLRRVFVAHNGTKELTIEAIGNRFTTDFGKMALAMTGLIQKNVLDPTLQTWIIPDFTTTTPNDRVVSSVVMMATLKAYFSYTFSLGCGLPAVTLMGEKKDWVKLVDRIEKLPSFGPETTQWHALLKPVLTRFVKAFDAPNSEENKEFWQKIAHREQDGSGPEYLSGWITAFTFFSEKGKSLYKQLDGTVLDGVQYHTIDAVEMPPAHAEVDVTLDDNGVEFKTMMVAGVVGYRVLDSGMTTAAGHNGKRDTVQPVTGWWMFEKKPEAKEPAAA